MLQLLIHIFTYGFDLFILLKFLQNILKNRRENIPVIFFYGTGVLMEIILFLNEYLMVFVPDRPAKYITNIVSFLTTFLLTLFFSSSLISKIFTTLSLSAFGCRWRIYFYYAHVSGTAGNLSACYTGTQYSYEPWFKGYFILFDIDRLHDIRKKLSRYS